MRSKCANPTKSMSGMQGQAKCTLYSCLFLWFYVYYSHKLVLNDANQIDLNLWSIATVMTQETKIEYSYPEVLVLNGLKNI